MKYKLDLGPTTTTILNESDLHFSSFCTKAIEWLQNRGMGLHAEIKSIPKGLEHAKMIYLYPNLNYILSSAVHKRYF